LLFTYYNDSKVIELITMKYIINQLFLVILLILQFACTSSELDPNTRQPVNTIHASMKTLSSQKLVMIYDFNQETSSLEYRAVIVENPTGNELKDLINTFLNAQQFVNIPTTLRLEKIIKEKNKTILDFSSFSKFVSNEDRLFFIEALEMTITRNTNLSHFLIKNI